MTRVEVDLLTDQGNNAVLRLPGRKSPGVLIQGDSLSVLVGLVDDAVKALARDDSHEAESTLREVTAQLEEARDRYEAALKQHGLPRPY